MERALNWARQERATLRASQGKPSVDSHDIPQDEQLRARRGCSTATSEFAEEGSFLFPHVEQTLAALHDSGLPLALVTNKPTPFVAPILERWASPDIHGGDWRRRRTEQKAASRAAAEKSERRDGAAAILFVGDSRNDIQAAKAAGRPSVGLTTAITMAKPSRTANRMLSSTISMNFCPLSGRHIEPPESDHD
ncbi:HAD family hydrolase [Escherichia coli]